MTEQKQASGSIEEALMRELRFGGIDKDNLHELVGIVAHIQKSGLKSLKVFPKGIPPIIDSLKVTGTVDSSGVTKLLAEILPRTPRLAGLEVFPYGIPWPEIFRVAIDLGAPVQVPVEAGQLRI